MLASGLLFGGSQAWAAAPPANTVIGNQATANYLDPNGLTQSATSNIVQTTVQQVGSFNLDGATTTTTTVQNTKTGAASAVVYAPHVLTNTGNGSDAFSITVAAPGPNGSGTLAKVAVYADANFDGLPDSTTALCTVTPSPSGNCSVPAQTVAGSNGQFGFVVAYTLPATVNTTATPYASATITAVPSTTALYAAANQSVSNVDNVNSTTTAAFNLTKAVQQPAGGINAPGGGAWPVAASTGKRSVFPAGTGASACATSWSPGLTSTANCQYTVYTMTYSNTGGAPGRFNLQDVIGTGSTSGLQYVSGSAVWSGASGTAMNDASGANDPSGVDYIFNSGTNTMTFVDNAVPVNTPRSISFVVLVTNTAAVGTSTTSNTATFNPADAAAATALAPVGQTASSSNASVFTVLGSYSIALGSASSTATTALDTTAGTPNAGAADTTTVAGAPAGSYVSFTQTVFNTGNATDTVNISSANPGTGGPTAFPAGTTFAYYKADGATLLNDTNADGSVDKMIAGANITCTFVNSLNGLVGVVFNDGGAPSGGANTGTPNDGLKNGSEAGLQGVAVTLSNCSATTLASTTTDNNGAWTLNIPATVTAGTTVCVTAAVPANGMATGAYAGSGGGTAVPSGTPTTVGGVTYTYDRASQQMRFAAPAGGTATFGFGQVPRSTFGSSSNRQAPPNTAVLYPHTFLSGTGGNLSLAITSEAASPNSTPATWSGTIHADPGCTGTVQSGATQLYPGSATIAVVQGQNVCVVVREQVPANADSGSVNQTTVQATLALAGANPALSASYTLVDSTTVGSSALSLLKEVRNLTTGGAWGASNQAKSGQVLEYRVTYTNNATSPMTKVSIMDTVPGYTIFQAATAGTPPPGLGNCTMNTPANPAPAPAVGCATTQTAGGTGSLKWMFDGTLNPQATGTIGFTVKVE